MFSRALVIAGFLSVLAAPAFASAFHGFTVVNVPEGDVLNARTGPGTAFAVQTAYPNGTGLSLTGICTDGLKLDDLGGLTQGQKYAHVKTRWCQIWHDPQGGGAFTTGWVHGRFIYPH